MIEFFDIEPYRQEAIEKSTTYYVNGEKKGETERYRLIPNKMPTLYQFARKIKVAYSTVYRWAVAGEDEGAGPAQGKEYTEAELEEISKRHGQIKEFCNAYKEAKELQKEFLISIGLAGAAPSPAFIFTAKNVTDMRDEQEVKHSGTVNFSLLSLRSYERQQLEASDQSEADVIDAQAQEVQPAQLPAGGQNV